MAMSRQSLPPVNQYTGSYTEDVDGDGVRLNAFDHEDASIAYDPLSANLVWCTTKSPCVECNGRSTAGCVTVPVNIQLCGD